MKKALLCATLAALFVHASASAADPAAHPGKPPSAAFEALRAANTELKAVFGDGRGNPVPMLDKMTVHQYSEDTRAKMAKAFGPGVPGLAVNKASATGDQLAYAFSLPAYAQTAPASPLVKWADFSGLVTVDKQGRTMVSRASWPSLSIEDTEFGVLLTEMAFDAKQKRSPANLWLGDSTVRIGQVRFSGKDAAEVAVMEDIAVASKVVQRAKLIDYNFDIGVKAIKAAGEQVDGLRFAGRLVNADERVMVAIDKAIGSKQYASLSEERQEAMLMAQMKTFAKSAATRGTALLIDDLSASYRGHKAQISGKMSLAPSTEADFASAETFVKKIILRLNVKVPLGLVTEVSRTVMAKQAAAKGEPMSEAALAQASQAMADMVTGKVLASGFARLDNGVFTSTIDFKGGKLFLNGKEVALPKGRAKSAPATEEEEEEDEEEEAEQED